MFDILYNLVITPITLLISLTFSLGYRLTQSQGLAIIGVSLVVNLLCFPLYRLADIQQEEERLKQRSMERWVTHIKQHFSGDEQYMMLTTYYAEQGYNPLRTLISSLSLLLQIPFFIAAYSYLSELQILNGAHFLFLSDLGQPDALLSIGSWSVNVMPIAMTLFNCVSTFIYTREHTLRDKVQAYALAGVFLVLLYNSPSGLVFYWTCNQVLSLLKNLLLLVFKRPKRLLFAAAQALVLSIIIWFAVVHRTYSIKQLLILLLIVGLIELVAFKLFRNDKRSYPGTTHPVLKGCGKRLTNALFIALGVLLALLMGLVIPSSVLADSPTEFISVQTLVNPNLVLLNSTVVWIGVFVLWGSIFFFLSPNNVRQYFVLIYGVVAAIALVDYFFFGKGQGTITNALVFEHGFGYTRMEKILNLMILMLTTVITIIVMHFIGKMALPAVAIICVALVGLSVPSIATIQSAYDEVRQKTISSREQFFDSDGKIREILALSKTQKNVVVFFLDRSISGYIPFIMHERPKLIEQFDGFTYYPNTLSFGQCTNYGAPPMYGGYEYTPTEMNARANETLASKHNEALRVLPKLFSDANYRAFVTNPPYGNYQLDSDLSVFDDIANLSAYNTKGMYSGYTMANCGIQSTGDLADRFVRYAVLKVIPECIQPDYYDEGKYLSLDSGATPTDEQIATYSDLFVLPRICAADSGRGCFLFLANELPHTPSYFQLPDYTLVKRINNEGLEDMSRFQLPDGQKMKMENDLQMMHYHSDMASLIKLGEWFDWMREQDVYDNTRIIIVADHGTPLAQFSELLYDDELDIEMVNPLLMVKDFDSRGWNVSDEFMTNADTPSIALDGVMDNPANPATGKRIDMSPKYEKEQIITSSSQWDLSKHGKNKFDTSDGNWYSVHDDIFDLNNWKLLSGEVQ